MIEKTLFHSQQPHCISANIFHSLPLLLLLLLSFSFFLFYFSNR